ncbi:hypothetical protein IKP94_03520 [Candidatus Saccharibacteria bacterium]|nr:hypothetical protein [Candidatus Saccharibacteria bacterium]
MPVLSLHIGGQTAAVKRVIVDPEDLSIMAFELEGPIIRDPEIGSFLMAEDIRETSNQGLVVDSADRFVNPEDVIRLNEVLELNFNLEGLKVVTKEGKNIKKLGKIIDYTVDSSTLSIFQIIAQRPFMESFVDPQLTINRSQITEVDDFKITIKHDKQKIKVEQSVKETKGDFVPNYTNPFRKPTYSPVEEDMSDNSSSTSE